MNHRFITVAAMLAALAVSPSAYAEEETIDDGPPGEDKPKDLTENPVQLALEQLPICGSDPDAAPADLAAVFAEVPASAVIVAVEDGEVLYPMLTNAVNAVGVLGTSEDLAYLYDFAEDIAWSYADLGVQAEATDEAVLENHGHKMGRPRRDVLWTWSRKEPVPKQRLLNALQDDSFRVRMVAMQLALADGDAELDAEAHAVCDAEPLLAEAVPLCAEG